MKEIIKYIADDGTTFDTEKDCIDYEKSMNSYIVLYGDKESYLTVSKAFSNEIQAKRFIADCLHMCYKNNIMGKFKLVHHKKTVEFNSNELAHLVPAHYNIDGEKLNKIFQMSTTKNVKIPGYTLHGDYYLADEVIPNKTWEEACKMKKPVKLPNGELVIAYTLSKEELETIPEEQRKISENGHYWYWTSTPYDDNRAWYVNLNGYFYSGNITHSYGNGGVRLGFKNPFTN